jgi:DNA-directed RNA polymerase specialized sigma subunit
MLSERHRQVITMHYFEGMTLKQIGARITSLKDGSLGVSEGLVSQTHQHAIELLAQNLARQGIRREDIEL